MPYLVEADFREKEGPWYTAGLDPIDVSVVSPAQLTAAIAAQSERFDELTNDHYEPEPIGAGTTTIDVDSWGLPFLDVPKRIRSITAVHVIDSTGALTLQDGATYRVTQSLVGGVRQIEDVDQIGIVPDRYLTTGKAVWPTGPGVVRLTGTFSWAAPPERVKRAVALLVYDALLKRHPDKLRAERWEAGQASFLRSDSKPTGIPEVDEIVAEFNRKAIRIR